MQHEEIEWAREFGQDIFLFKLDFRFGKAYDTVSLPLYFQAIRRVSKLEAYISMTKGII